jgi:hypothetical protein
MTITPSILHERHRRLCQVEDEFVVTLVCAPDGMPLNSTMVAALEWVQERRSFFGAQLEGCR